MDLTTATPAEIDSRLADLHAEDAKLTSDIASEMTGLRTALGQQRERIITRQGKAEFVWLISSYDTERAAVAEVEAYDRDAPARTEVVGIYRALHALRQEVLRNRAERIDIATEFDRRGGWTRAWAVPGGHIHNSQYCHTCFPTTYFGWLPQVSGLDEDEIVALAGERACTVCYPSAPVNVIKQACRLWTTQETADAQAMADRALELKAKRDAKAAKGITNPDGTPLRDSSGFVIKSEVTAEREAVALIHDHHAYGYTEQPELVEQIVIALAHKRGVSTYEVEAAILAKAEKKVAKTKREMSKY